MLAPRKTTLEACDRDMPKVTPLYISALLVTALLSLPAGAEEIHVVCPMALAAPMKALGDEFSAQSGTRVTFTFDKVQVIRAKLDAGEKADLVVLPQSAIKTLEGSKMLQAGSSRSLGRVPLAVAVRADATVPDVSTPAKFRDALLAADSVAYTDPATGSAGGLLASNLLAKSRFGGVHAKSVTGPASAAVVRGEASLALQPMSELVRTTGIKIAGRVPFQLHAELDFTASVSRGAAPETFALLRFLTSESASSTWTRNGVLK
jgi:molybdate transport system substrate-binding protein